MLRRSSVVHPSPASRWGAQGAASGPRFVCKDISLRCRGCPPGRERLPRQRLRRRLPQTPDADGGRMCMTMNRLQCDIQRQVLQARSPAPGAAEDDVARGGGHRPQCRRLGVEVRPSVSGRLPRADRGRHHEDRHGCPPARRGRPLTFGGSQQDHVDHDTCVLTTRTLQGAVLDLAVVPSDSKPHVVVSALENAVLPDDRVGVQWVVVDNASPALYAALWSFPSLRGVALDTCHLPMKYEAVASHQVQRAPGCSVSLSASSTCPSVRRSARTWTRLRTELGVHR